MAFARVLAGAWVGVAVSLGAAASPAAEEFAQVTVASTTDLHGHIYPLDYYTDRPAQFGLAKIATLVAAARREAPHLVLLDCGDTLQGTPLEYYHNRVENAPPDPMMVVMNALHYDAMAVGNHDYNYGLQVQRKAHSEAAFPWLSANTYRAGSTETALQPYLVKVVDGVRVGILGLTTPDIPYWDDAPNYAGLEFHDPVAEAKKWVSVLRERERADVVVVAMHMGLEQDLATGGPGHARQLPHENSAVQIAREVPGIDLILLGHTHRNIPSVTINGVLLTQAERWGYRLALAQLYLRRPAGGAWRVWAKSADTVPVTERTRAEPRILELVKSYHAATETWLGRAIGTSAKTLSAGEARLRDTAIIDLVHRAQLEAGHADVSLTSVFNPSAVIPAGPVSVRQICGIYVYDNTLVVVELTGRQLKEALEHSARYFLPYQPGKTAAELMDLTMPGYNFDTAAGVGYVIDLARPPGDRIRDLTFQGQPLDPERKLRVATNNYRANGGGEYEMLKRAPVVFRDSEEIRNLIIQWVERHHEIPTEPMNNWRMVTP